MGSSESEVERSRRQYEPPTLTVLGTLVELTRGVAGASDGLGPGSLF